MDAVEQAFPFLSFEGRFSSSSGRRVVPALGLAWSNVVTVRVLVMRTPYTLSQVESTKKVHSSPEVIICPFMLYRFYIAFVLLGSGDVQQNICDNLLNIGIKSVAN